MLQQPGAGCQLSCSSVNPPTRFLAVWSFALRSVASRMDQAGANVSCDAIGRTLLGGHYRTWLFRHSGRDSEDGILRPASVYSPKKRIVAIASKETGTHIPFSCANCIVRCRVVIQKEGLLAGTP